MPRHLGVLNLAPHLVNTSLQWPSVPRIGEPHADPHIVHSSDHTTPRPHKIDMATPIETSEKEKLLLQQLEEQKRASQQLQQELAELRIENEIEMEKQKQEQCAAIGKLKEIQDKAKEQHEAQLNSIQEMIKNMTTTQPGDDSLMNKLKTLLNQETEEEKMKREAEEAERRKTKEMVESLVTQHKQIQEQLSSLDISKMDTDTKVLLSTLTQPTLQHSTPAPPQQDQLMEQLRRALTANSTEDPQKTVLKQFLTKSNTTSTQGGATTLKPLLLKQLMGEEEDFNMADWLARFNKEEQGEFKPEVDEEVKQKIVSLVS